MGTSTKAVLPTTLLVVTKAGLNYNPKATTAQNNHASWATIKTALKSKPQTYGQLMAIVAKKHNHAPMVGYCVRRGWLAVK